MSNSTDRRSFPHSRLSAVAAAKRSRGVGIGLLAIAVVFLGDEARGQVGVESDREVLEAFYHATGGPDWFDSTNWLSDASLAEWYGVSTNDEGRVVQLILHNNSLSGPIPPELPRLTRLVHLSLFQNQLSGPIPPELGQLTSLQSLNLFSNQLSGPIPPELGQLTNLGLLHLDFKPVDRTDPARVGPIDSTVDYAGSGVQPVDWADPARAGAVDQSRETAARHEPVDRSDSARIGPTGQPDRVESL